MHPFDSTYAQKNSQQEIQSSAGSQDLVLKKENSAPLIFSKELQNSSAEKFWAVVKNELSYNSKSFFISFEDQITLPRKTVEAMLSLGVAIPPQDISKFIQRLNEAHISLEKIEEEGFSPLHLASIAGRDDRIDSRLDPNALDKKERSPLHLAAIFGHVQVAKRLLEIGAFPDFCTPEERSPITVAKKFGEQEIAQLLITNTDSTFEKSFTLFQKLLPYHAYIQGRRFTEISENEEIAKALHRTKHDRLKNFKMYFKKILSLSPYQIELHKYYKKETAIRLLTHSWGIKMQSKDLPGYPLRIVTQLGTKMVSLKPFEGGRPFYLLQKMLKGTQKFIQAFSGVGLIKSSSLLELKETLFYAADRQKVTNQDLLDRYKQNKPVMLVTGFEGHTMNILIWNTHFIVCNRGDLTRKPLEFFQFEPNTLTPDVILDIWKMIAKPIESYYESLYSTWPTTLQLKKTDIDIKLDALSSLFLPFQKVLNCGWTSPEAAVFAFLVLDILKEKNMLSPPTFNDIEVGKLFIERNLVFQNWVLLQKLDHLQVYLDISAKEEKNLYSNFDVYDEVVEQYNAEKNKSYVHPILKTKMLELEDRYQFLKNDSVKISKSPSVIETEVTRDKISEVLNGLEKLTIASEAELADLELSTDSKNFDSFFKTEVKSSLYKSDALKNAGKLVKSLTIQSGTVSNECIKELALMLPNLQSLTIMGDSKIVGSKEFGAFTKLEQVTIIGEHANLRFDTFARSLKVLRLYNIKLSLEQLKGLVYFDNLEEFTLWENNDCLCSDKIVKYLPRSLKTLALCKCNLTDDKLKDLARLDKLESLNLSMNKQLTGQYFNYLPRSLKNIQLFDCDILDDSIKHLGLYALEEVNLSMNQHLTGATLNSLPKELKVLTMWTNPSQLTPEGEKNLEELKKKGVQI